MTPAWIRALLDGVGFGAGALLGAALERLARMAFYPSASDTGFLFALALGLGGGIGLGGVRRWQRRRRTATPEE